MRGKSTAARLGLKRPLGESEQGMSEGEHAKVFKWGDGRRADARTHAPCSPAAAAKNDAHQNMWFHVACTCAVDMCHDATMPHTHRRLAF